jgi:hypothetical protein
VLQYDDEGSIYPGVRHPVSTDNLAAMLFGISNTPSTPSAPTTLLSPVNDYGTPAPSPYSDYGTPHPTQIAYTEPNNVRFEIHDLAQGLDYPDGVFDIVHCRYVLTLGVRKILQLTCTATDYSQI